MALGHRAPRPPQLICKKKTNETMHEVNSLLVLYTKYFHQDFCWTMKDLITQSSTLSPNSEQKITKWDDISQVLRASHTPWQCLHVSPKISKHWAILHLSPCENAPCSPSGDYSYSSGNPHVEWQLHVWTSELSSPKVLPTCGPM